MALGITQPLAAFVDNVDRNSYTASGFTPAAGSVILIFCTMTGFTGTPTISGGSGWDITPVFETTATFNSGVSTLGLIKGVAGGSPGSFAAAIGCTGATGCMMSFFQITGANTVTPVVQTKIKNSTTGSNPSITFDANLNTNNCYLEGIAVPANPAGVTPPSSWTESDDTGHTSPATGLETSYRINGESGATITATRSSINHGIIGVEIAVAPTFDPATFPFPGTFQPLQELIKMVNY